MAVYLTEPVLRQLLRTLREHTAPNSTLAVSFAVTTGNQEFEALRAVEEQRLARLGEEPRTRPSREEVYRLLRDAGWRPCETVSPENPEFGADASEAVFVRALATA